MTPRAELCPVVGKANRSGSDWCAVPREQSWEYEDCKMAQRERRISFRREATGIEDIEAAVSSSHWILQLAPDWDGEGSASYERAVWERATNFVLTHANALRHTYGRRMDVPRISPGPKGSIDVHWKTQRYELLVNFPSEPNGMATFYGDDYRRMVIKGTLDPKARNLGLLEWLAQPV